MVFVVNEDHRRGFAYGTLPGHPECGEEFFLIERVNDTVTFTITAFSRPASRLATLAGPLGSFVQDQVTQRYLHAVDPH